MAQGATCGLRSGMRDAVLLLPSPLLPASAYGDLVEALDAVGLDTFVATPELGPGEVVPADIVQQWATANDGERLLLAHSNAGYLAPAVRAMASSDQRLIFMDAALPPTLGKALLAPPAFRAHLARLADDHGLLPPWTRWWTPEELAGVIPHHRFDALDRSCPRLPLSYFDGETAVPLGWVDGPDAYLAFGDTYADELAFAMTHGWPWERLEGGHLHFLHEPSSVAAHVQRLAAALSST